MHEIWQTYTLCDQYIWAQIYPEYICKAHIDLKVAALSIIPITAVEVARLKF